MRFRTQVNSLRQLLVTRGGGRKDVLGLAMALRVTRLQQAAAVRPLYVPRIHLPASAKQQLAMETLQLWAPLSFQVGLSGQLPELEVNSYALLFPRSFGTFVNWYSEFRPAARALLREFRSSLEDKLSQDAALAKLANGVLIQSRMKSPPSAFKKMIKVMATSIYWVK
jgi:(p)ppGpp synthase/HD superfamily hydrolase